MKISLKIIVLLLLANPVFSQKNLPIIQATSNSVDIKVDETLYENNGLSILDTNQIYMRLAKSGK